MNNKTNGHVSIFNSPFSNTNDANNHGLDQSNINTKNTVSAIPHRQYRQSLITTRLNKIGALCFAAFILFFYDFSAVKAQETTLEKPEASSGIAISSQGNVGNVTATQEVDRLNQLALTALEDGRLIEPNDNNVIYYLKQVSQLDAYNPKANVTRKKLLQLLEASYQEQSSQGDNAVTIKTLNAILEIEPYNQVYTSHLNELNNRINLENLAQKEVVINDVIIENNEPTPPLDPILDNAVRSVEQSATIEVAQSKQVSEYELDIAPKSDLQASISKEAIEVSPAVNKIQHAEVLKRVEPTYPKFAIDLYHEGWIELEYQVDIEGNATEIKVVNGDKINTFSKAAINAIKQWEFSPSLDLANNTPQLSKTMTTKFQFELNQ